ncbi:hypothetical protein F8M41_025082 [Gigaspora margarita]|uniref:Uncharacterized protein n=1 Tax=Gigaspora margarita TaxID=4874 RepID=A0A8H3XN63_GIGMA|nr:hypothetical protein F8M41_025082 [Gigaspora margarita]
MPPKQKSLPTPPHIANDNSYRPPSPPAIESEPEKKRRLDRKRKAVTKWYKNYPNYIIESSASTSTISNLATTSATTLATTSATTSATILATTLTTTFTIVPTTTSTTFTTFTTPPSATSLESVTNSSGSQSFISTTLSEAFADSTTLDLSANLQQRESNRIRQQQYR